MHNPLLITEAQFKKAAKKLASHLQDSHSLPLKLNQSQELLAKTLGFRNTHDLQQACAALPAICESSTVPSFSAPHEPYCLFHGLDGAQCVQVISVLMSGHPSEEPWKSRIINLATLVLRVLVHLRHHNELVIDACTLTHYFSLEALSKVSTNRTDLPPDLKHDLHDYLKLFNDKEQHLDMLLRPALEDLKKIEKDNLMLAHHDWFSPVELKKLKENPLLSYIFPHVLIKRVEFWDESWLEAPGYVAWIKSINRYHSRFCLRLSDLVLYISRIISPQKRSEMEDLLHSILSNHGMASEMSRKFCESSGVNPQQPSVMGSHDDA